MLAACQRLGGDARELRIAPPATEAEVETVESELGQRLPASFRRVLTDFSAEVEFRWFLPEELPRPPAFGDNFCGECRWSLSQLTNVDGGRREWIDSCFADPEDAYNRVWHHKLGFLQVDNGDVLALDVLATSAPVVYLSHDGGEGHGYQLGADFEDFIDRWSLLGCPGAEDWQMLPFITGPTSFLDPHGANAVLWREFLQLTVE
ncbi:MAG: hypothetical protein K0Q72_1849 [Armatimonadetes bacterium]|nr:hypothetical protein [Armatimonadota bacterium]